MSTNPLSASEHSLPLFVKPEESYQDKTEPSATAQKRPGNSIRELTDNFFRDFPWAGLSHANINLLGQPAPALNLTGSLSSLITSGAFLGPMAAQFLFGSAPMVILAAGETIYRKLKGETLPPEEIAKIWAPPTAAALAIPMWDIGQLIGAHLGATSSLFQSSPQWFGLSIAAGIIAAPFAGVLEGFTQWSVKYLFDVATNPVTREMWRQDPALMGKVLVKELLLNVTIGAIPGAIWQVVFFFAMAGLTVALGPVGGIILAALLVGLAVMLCNFVCTHLINKASGAIDHCIGWDTELEELKKRSRDKLSTKIEEFPTKNNVDSSEAENDVDFQEVQPPQTGEAGNQGLSG